MPSPLFDSLPRSQQSTIASAGYRLGRWEAARLVLGNRLAKQRFPEALVLFLQRWSVLVEMPPKSTGETCELGLAVDHVWLLSGLAAQPQERALLHLPALRSFWRQELRAEQFEALLHSVPQAWFRDESPLPPGAVISGLGLSSWAELPSLQQRQPPLESQDNYVCEAPALHQRIQAHYKTDDKGRIVLASVKALP